MFRSALAAALRHLFRGKLYAAIAVFGLAVGLCAALLAGLYIYSQYSHYNFLAGYQDVYQATMRMVHAERTDHTTSTPAELAALMKQRFPEVASVTRISIEVGAKLRVGDVELTESDRSLVNSVDPDFFDVLPFPVLAGDPVAALAQPNQLVITRQVAHKLFGDAPPLGRTLEVVQWDGASELVTVVTVGAVIDVPDNRPRALSEALVSSRSAWTKLASYDNSPPGGRFFLLRGMPVWTLVRLHPGASPLPVRKALPELLSRMRADGSEFLSNEVSGSGERKHLQDELGLLRIDRVHPDPDLNPEIVGRMAMTAALALVILAIAAVNFVNLLTARSAARVLEVGVRKLAGAGRTTLAAQFLGEAFFQVAIAMMVAVAMTELLLPHVNAFLDVRVGFDYWKEPTLFGWIFLGTLVLGLLAGFWPALVLSALRPLGAMRSARLARGSGGVLRQSVLSLQFALLTGLILAAAVVYLQRQYAIGQALRFETDQVLIVEMDCTPARMIELRGISGVRDAACSDINLLGGGRRGGDIDITTRDGRSVPMSLVTIDDRMFGLYGIASLAGRMLTAADFDLMWPNRNSTRVLINESAMQALGFEAAAAAIGPYPLAQRGGPLWVGFDEIVGVVPDFSMGPVSNPVGPTIFFANPVAFSAISVKLKGDDVPATLAAIDRVWKETGGTVNFYADTSRLNYYFYEDRVQRMYLSMLRDAHVFGIISLVAISLALLGLLGLAASVADQRTKEVGIRKALGATTSDVLRLLLWQFSKPVLWANLIAWPAAGYLLQRWLSGFAYRIDLPLWLFPVTALVVLLIALATVSAQALAVARLRPVVSLRHE